MKTFVLCALVGFTLSAPILRAQATATSPAPIPEEARKHFVMGVTLFKEAKTSDDFAQVESQFKRAVDLAPQWPDARYNLALSKEAAGDYAGALADLKIYQQFSLSDADARTAQDKIYALEAKAEEAVKKQAEIQKAAAAEQAKAQQLADAKQIAERFRGTWYGAQCYPGNQQQIGSLQAGGCTSAQYSGHNWHDFWMNGAAIPGSFEAENDGTIKMDSYSAWAGCQGDVYGIPQGTIPWYSIRWEVRPKDGSSPYVIWSGVNDVGTQIIISCTKPNDLLNHGDPPYRYVMWTRTP